MRKVEALAQESKAESRKPKEKENPYETLQQELSAATGLKVKIQDGKVVLTFGSEQELQQIIDRLR